MFILRRNFSLASLLFRKYDLDYSRVPELNKKDLKEQFVRGSGPGGQSVSKTSNCVVLQHIPTGIVVKCHHSRSLTDNRKTARELLLAQLDIKLNGQLSLNAQIQRLDEKRQSVLRSRKKKLNELKRAWKEREGIE